MVECNKIPAGVLASMLMAMAVVRAAGYDLYECQSKAAEGNAEAQWQLGQRYENGDGVKKNAVRALVQYKKAAEQRHHQACKRLAELYEKGALVKRDLALAAKYKAWAEGGDGEQAEAEARASSEKANVDEIDTALDYILGRNGRPKDPKTGIRILYQSAKDKPVAQRVFVARWCKGDLDGSLDMLSAEEWDKIIPWFKNAWDSGIKDAGQILGLDAYSAKDYSKALHYWQESNKAKCWLFVGRFYDTLSEEGKGGGPSSMRDETKARKAYERCLRLERDYDEAKFNLGLIYLFSKKPENENLPEAKRIFYYFLKKGPEDKWYNYDYGLAGYWLLAAQFDKNWPKRTVDKLLSWRKNYNDSYGEMTEYDRQLLKEYNKMLDAYEQMRRAQEEFVVFIRKAANLGCEPAKRFLENQ